MKYIVANFKMYKTVQEAEDYAKQFVKLVKKCENKVAVCPSFVCIGPMAKIFKGKVQVGGQNCSDKEEGAYTGEVSASMLKSAGATLTILGHSERRRDFGETDKLICEKIKLAQKNGLDVIVCLADDGGEGYKQNIRTQVKDLFAGVDKSKEIVIAFEPVWAIGTGKTMNTKDIKPVVETIKNEARKVLKYEPKVLYGGSVNSGNASEILALDCVDGLLVGGASKNPQEFAKICFS